MARPGAATPSETVVKLAAANLARLKCKGEFAISRSACKKAIGVRTLAVRAHDYASAR